MTVVLFCTTRGSCWQSNYFYNAIAICAGGHALVALAELGKYNTTCVIMVVISNNLIGFILPCHALVSTDAKGFIVWFA